MKLGVIGGLGPIATAYFLELIIKMTDVSCDQDHLDMIIYNTPSTPDRTAYILGKSNQSPVTSMIQTGHNLVQQNVDIIAIPCITAHYFYEELSIAINRPIINVIVQTALQLKQFGIETVGITATDGTLAGQIFQKELDTFGITSVLPSPRMQMNVMKLIYDDIKAGRPIEMNIFNDISEELRRNGAQAIILGCTELSLIKRDCDIGAGYIDAMEVLAKASIESCGAPLKQEYRCLISS